MIKPASVDKLLDIARVEEVVGDYVNLKKRGVNQIGLCPFHDEKTPSFTVSPTKGIFKCFGCGESGNAIGFVMKHEQLGFVDATRLIAQKYNFTLEETEQTEEEKQLKDDREALYIVTDFAKNYYQNNLLNTDEGKYVGLSYFKERGFTEKTIKSFDLGYAFEGFHNFLNEAERQQYSRELLQKANLIGEKNGNFYDFFRDRVMFPIHNTTGKVVAFAGRTLKADKKIPKYVNSAESEIYNKSEILYGLYQAKSAISKQDNCFLVEGYTDVISLHQAGIENVVASSGTSLTTGQVKRIKRYTQNITLLFDGDAAGLNAAMRGVDLILPQDVNVNVVALPEEHDPDSFIKELGFTKFNDYVEEHLQDFILFKLEKQLKGKAKNPVARAEAASSVIQSIALIPDSIKRSFYIKECSEQLQIDEQVLHLEVNKARRNEFQRLKKLDQREKETLNQVDEDNIQAPNQGDQQKLLNDRSNILEKAIIRIFIEFGHLNWEDSITVSDYILFELVGQEFENEKFQTVLNLYRDAKKDGVQLVGEDLYKSDNEVILNTVIEATNLPYELSENWKKKHDIFIETDKNELFHEDVKSVVSTYKLHKAQELLEQKMQLLKTKLEFEEEMEVLNEILHLKDIIKQENEELKRNNYLH